MGVSGLLCGQRGKVVYRPKPIPKFSACRSVSRRSKRTVLLCLRYSHLLHTEGREGGKRRGEKEEGKKKIVACASPKLFPSVRLAHTKLFPSVRRPTNDSFMQGFPMNVSPLDPGFKDTNNFP